MGRDNGHLAPVMLNQLARYSAVLPLLGGSKEGKLLEVGSGSEGIARFLKEGWEITVSDRDFSDYGVVRVDSDDRLKRVQADVTELPFADGEFDVVLALDLLEHVPAELRERALRELARVSRLRLIVGCPCGEPALRFDRGLARWYRLLPTRSVPRWLEEHLENGFPEGAEIEAALTPFGEVELHPNEWLWSHLVISIFEATPIALRGTLRGAAVLEAGLENSEGHGRARWLRALRGGDRQPSYRQIAVLARPAS
jgi:SAM-dependent methyltransferase